MRPRDRTLADRLLAAIARYESDVESLRGITSPHARDALVEQLVESDRRVRFFATIAERPVTPVRADPGNPAFDPIRAAVLHHGQGDLDEACWLVFLFVLFGKNRRSGYRLAADVYGRLGGGRWTWNDVHRNPADFSAWIDTHASDLRGRGGKFGNHRKYESIPAIGRVVASYVAWVGAHHAIRFRTHTENATSPEAAFEALYRSMDGVHRFGRVGRFDYLSTLGRLGLVDARPGRPYFPSATGPKTGGELLYGRADLSTRELEARTVHLGKYLDVGFDVLEDALCNWQKSPTEFRPFRG